MGGLDTYAAYVDGIANGNANTITLAGFVPTKEGSTEHPVPAQPAGATITRGGIGEMFAEVPKVDGADYYGCIVFAGQPIPPQLTLNGAGQLVLTADNSPTPPGEAPKTGIQVVFDVSKSRKKRLLGLQTGTMYYFYFYAGNATGVSILSEGRNAVCG